MPEKRTPFFKLSKVKNMQKFNLGDFQHSKLDLDKVLEIKGGAAAAAGASGTVKCQTITSGGDADYKNCDSDWNGGVEPTTPTVPTINP